MAKENHTNGLTLTNLERILHDYFKIRGGGPASDETAQIMAFIKQNRGQTITKRLKKIT